MLIQWKHARPGQWKHARSGRWNVAVAAVLIAVVMVRALIPAGYMLAPVTGDVTAGLFKLTICSSVGSHKSKTSDPSDPSPVQSPAGNGQPCGFAVAMADAMPRDTGPVVVVPPFETTPPAIEQAFSLATFPAGPQLGARAPPARSDAA